MPSIIKDLQINLKTRSFINILLAFTDLLGNLSYSVWTHFCSCHSFSFRLAADLVCHVAALDINFFSKMCVFRMPGIYTHISIREFEECQFVTVKHFHEFLYLICVFDHYMDSFRASSHKQHCCFIASVNETEICLILLLTSPLPSKHNAKTPTTDLK